MRRRALRLAVLLVAAIAAAPAAASATTLPNSFTPPCPTASPSGGDYGGVRICSGEVPSFDGAALDVDVTQPMQNTGAPHPLIIMLHGFGNNKHEWESTTDEGDGADKWHWNNRWFAEHGYYVLTYTARGFRDDGTTGGYQPPTPGDVTGSESAPNGTIHVKSRDYEIRDTQWLAALLAATYLDVDRSRVAVTGGSYGGGESWMQASQANWDFPHSQDPTLPVLALQVAIPKYPWTDLAYALAPNGHGGGPSGTDIYESSQAQESDNNGGGTPATGNPLGAPKLSYVVGLYTLGTKQGVFDEGTDVPPPSNQDCTTYPNNCEENITAWNADITAKGDPYVYATDPVLQQAARGLTELRSAYYQDEGWTAERSNREVAIYSIQGWTDDLFEAVESFRVFKYLKRLDLLWPVSVAVADVGHSRAQNKPETWHRLNDQAFQFLQSQIDGSRRQETSVSSEPTICNGEPDQPPSTPADDISASTPEGLSNGALSILYAGGQHLLTNPGGAVDTNGPGTDPILGQPGCRTDNGSDLGGYTGNSRPLPNRLTYVGLGEIDVQVTLVPPAGQAQLDARVWDVPPSGPAFLMTRGTYRIDVLNGFDKPHEYVRLPLFGNHWRLMPGHKIRLDLTQVDQPYLRPNNEPSAIHFDSPTLVLPTRESQQETLVGTP